MKTAVARSFVHKDVHITHMKKKSQFGNGALLHVREVEASFEYSWISLTRANPGSVTTHGWESQKPKMLHLALWYLVLKMAETHIHKVQH